MRPWFLTLELVFFIFVELFQACTARELVGFAKKKDIIQS